MEIEQPLCFLGALSWEGSGSMLGGHMVERKEQMKSRSWISISPFYAKRFCSSAPGYGSLHFPEGEKDFMQGTESDHVIEGMCFVFQMQASFLQGSCCTWDT